MATPSTKNNSKWFRVCQDDIATIKNALTIISGYAQLLLREPELTSEQKEKLQKITEQTFWIADLLGKAKPEDPKGDRKDGFRTKA